ncbi:hypothetical protein [Sinomonas flava]|uniref:hypothetical protein n=1 Tax=Sinomonas TaxID=596707 RepID=UPI0039A6CC17
MSRPDIQMVIVRERGNEIHGYAVASGGGRVYVVWEVASGRRRQRGFRAEHVFVPGTELPWRGLPIPPDQLEGPHRIRR